MGSLDYPLTERIADSMAAHGMPWTLHHYCISRRGPKLSRAEWKVLSRVAYARQARMQ